ncbi:MAG: PilW family protein [Pseudomonadales bacterium]|nr:PilW family protein [Pseudomonadales bacterium]
MLIKKPQLINTENVRSIKHRALGKNQKGVTLFELLIASAMGLFIMAGVMQVFSDSKQTALINRSLSNIQDSGRIAMNLLTDDFRLIGYQGCADPDIIQPNIIAVPAPTANLYQTALQAYEVTGTGWAAGTDLTGIDGTGTAQAIVGSDVITVQRASSSSIGLTGVMTAENANIQITGNSIGFQQDDIVMISDCENADIFRVTNTPGTSPPVTLAHATGSNTGPNLGQIYSDDAQVMSFISNTYFVGDTGRTNAQGDNVNALYLLEADATDPLELIEGVDNMQLLFGQRLSNGNLRYLAADNTDIDWTAIEIVKLSLLISSTEVGLPANDEKTYLVAGGDIKPDSDGSATLVYTSDRRMRRAFNSAITIRNRQE